MRIKITAAVNSIRYVPFHEMGIRDHTEERSTDNMWTYNVIDERLFFLAVTKYGIRYHIHESEKCSV